MPTHLVAPPRDPDLEAALAANPDDRASYRAYADWLTERGDPQGEAIALALKDETSKATVATYAAATRRVDPAGFYRPAWRRGFVERATCLSEYEAMNPESWRHYPSSEEVAGFLASREARLLRELELVDTQSQTPCQLLLGVPAPPPLRALVIATGDDAARMTALWARYPRLRRLEVTCRELGAPALPELTWLALTAPAAQLAALAQAELPSLAELTLRLGHGEEVGAGALAVALPAWPALKEFTLCHHGDAGTLLSALLDSPLRPRLHQLDLSQARFPDGGKELLRAAEGGRLDHLARIDAGGRLINQSFARETVAQLRDHFEERFGVF